MKIIQTITTDELIDLARQKLAAQGIHGTERMSVGIRHEDSEGAHTLEYPSTFAVELEGDTSIKKNG